MADQHELNIIELSPSKRPRLQPPPSEQRIGYFATRPPIDHPLYPNTMYPNIGIEYQSVDDIDAGILDMIRLRQEKSDSDENNFLELKDKRNGRTYNWVRVPTAKTDESFRKSSDWFGKAINAMSKNVKDVVIKSAKRLAKYLKRKHTEAFNDFLEEEGHHAPPQMSAERQAAMFAEAGVHSKKSRRSISKFLRQTWGSKCLEPEYKVDLLGQGHTEVKQDSIEYAYDEGGIKTTIDYCVKNISVEASSQLHRELQARNVLPNNITRIDAIVGGDHGQGAFIAGARIVVAHNRVGNNGGETWFSFEISVAEVLCPKDNAEILELTIKDDLTEGLRTMAEHDLVMGTDAQGSIVSCNFGNAFIFYECTY